MLLALAPDLARDPARNVDPFIGTSGGAYCYPAAQAPFGMVAIGPDTRVGNGGAGYDKRDGKIQAFSMIHVDGVGLDAALDLPFLVRSGGADRGAPVGDRDVYASAFKDESASPGRYGVTLTDARVRVDLAARPRAALVRLAFAPDETRTVMFSPSMAAKGVDDATLTLEPARREVRGWVRGGGFTGKERYTVHFVARFDAPFTVSPDGTLTGKTASATLAFAPAKTPLRMKVGVSFVDEDGARRNLDRELPDWDLERVAADTRRDWNRFLGRVETDGGTVSANRTLYTALYHTALQPSVFSDADGRTIGFDDRIRTMPKGRTKYAIFSMWDTYRTQAALLAMLAPDVASDMVQSLLLDSQETYGNRGGLPGWSYYNDDNDCMGTFPAPLFAANAYAFGATNFDLRAWKDKAVACATTTDPLLRASSPEIEGGGWWSLDKYKANGYTKGVSETLEYAQTDMAISRLAEWSGDAANARLFRARAQNVFRLFNPKATPEGGYLQRRDENGAWVEPFAPTDTAGFTEGCSAQYTWGAPHNVARLITLMGGEDRFVARLDRHLSRYASGDWENLTGSPYWWAGNEPGFGVPFLYNWARRPDRTTAEVRRAMDRWKDTPDGLPGNDDTGALSAWGVFASIGLYPEIPGVGGFALFAPRFPEVRLRLAGDKTLTIRAKGDLATGFVDSATLNGQPFTKSWLGWEEATRGRGATLSYTLAPTPGLWGRAPGDVPPSFGAPSNVRR